ncbi:hypothetical protein [Celeribacter baekdonensis]|uniref:hypothetical protein n=1 Tax=Celeribacter baekdonensis TaxID=875171 RepID=UPI0030DB7700|tara:strand:+ start:363786 stop:364364 length:579 start_codon:yes stop_codon:yes gene_type:complete
MRFSEERIKTWIAGFVLMMAAWLFIALVVLPLSRWKLGVEVQFDTETSRIVQLQERLSSLQHDLSSASDLPTQDLLWTAPQIGEVTAKIQSTLTNQARDSGLALRSIAPTGAEEEDFATFAKFRLEGEVRLDSTLNFLRKLEGNAPPLLVRNATLRRLNRPGNAEEYPLLFIQLELVAPVRVGGNSAPGVNQ